MRLANPALASNKRAHEDGVFIWVRASSQQPFYRRSVRIESSLQHEVAALHRDRELK